MGKEKVSVEFAKDELDYYVEALEKVQSHYTNGSDTAVMIAMLRGKLGLACGNLIKNIEIAYDSYKKEVLGEHNRSQDEEIKDTLQYIEGFIGDIGNCLNTSGEYVDGEAIRSRVLDIESHLVALHEKIGDHCWQIEMKTMDLITALHKMLSANDLYY